MDRSAPDTTATPSLDPVEWEKWLARYRAGAWQNPSMPLLPRSSSSRAMPRAPSSAPSSAPVTADLPNRPKPSSRSSVHFKRTGVSSQDSLAMHSTNHQTATHVSSHSKSRRQRRRDKTRSQDYVTDESGDRLSSLGASSCLDSPFPAPSSEGRLSACLGADTGAPDTSQTFSKSMGT